MSELPVAWTTSVVMPADHPAFPGHFPGRPIVPGVLLLAHIASAIPAHAGLRVTGVRQAKFLSPLGPDEPCDVQCTMRNATRVDFECRAAGARVIARGTFDCAGQ